MTKPVSIQQRIRILDAQGVSWREIARRLGVSRDTVRKYATMEDCSPKPAVRKGRRSLTDAYSGTVDSWLFADRLMPRKQRHTCFASMFVRQVRQCFSVVWADGFPRCRHRFPVM